MMDAKLTLVQNLPVVALWVSFPMHQILSNLEIYGLSNDQYTSTIQSFVLAFDNRVALLYFDILTMKTTELDVEILTRNIDLSFNFKIV
mgnify:CR=1 FL=1